MIAIGLLVLVDRAPKLQGKKKQEAGLPVFLNAQIVASAAVY